MNSKENKGLKNLEIPKNYFNNQNIWKCLFRKDKLYFKRRANQLISFLIILCLLTLSTPAAPKTVADSAFLLHQNILISFRINDWFSFFSRSQSAPQQE